VSQGVEARVSALAAVLRRDLFWDVPLSEIDPAAHADWIIARVLTYGTLEDLRSVRMVYGDAHITQVIATHRSLSATTRQFWRQFWPPEDAIHRETLSPATAALWTAHAARLVPPGFVLAGDTAVALYLGHRQSEDLDFLTADPFDAADLTARLASLGDSVTVEVREPGTVHVRVDGVRVSYLRQHGVVVQAGPTLDGIPIASLETLMALKCNALANRGERKDFIDVYGLARAAGGLAVLLDIVAAVAPGLNRVHLLRSLTYFDDAEQSPMPTMLVDWSWAQIRACLTHDVADIIRHDLRPPGPGL
jgi:hypothetical protein